MDANDITAVLKCDDYDSDRIYEKLTEMSRLIGLSAGGIRGKRVVIKPNLLLAYPPEKAATTHPAVVGAAARLFSDLGAESVIIAESPGGIYNEKNLDRIYRITGMADAAESSGAVLNRDMSFREFSTPDGKVSKTVNVITPILESDVIVNICKMKTHSLAIMTGAAKNLFGVIPGIAKFEMHARFKKPEDFFSMVIDLDTALASGHELINICDGIVGMEGDGPSGGTPKPAGVLLMGRNPFCLDCVSARIMGLEGRVRLTELAASRGLCPEKESDAAVAGVRPEDVGCGNFALPDTALARKFRLIPPFLQPRPVIDKKICRGCGMCVKSCPQHTISMKNGKAGISHDRCIRCYCCQELCTFRAVKIKKSFIYRFTE